MRAPRHHLVVAPRSLLPLLLLSSFLLLSTARAALAQPAPPSTTPASLPELPRPPQPDGAATGGPPAQATEPPPAPEGPAPRMATPEPPPTPDGRPESPADAAPAPVPRRGYIHHGFYLGMGNGIADVGVRGEGPAGQASIAGLGSTVSLAIGGSPTPGLAIAFVIRTPMPTGSTFDGGPRVVATTTTTVSGQPVQTTSTLQGNASAAVVLIGAQVDWYPVATEGWHVGGGLGVGGAGATDDADENMAGATVGFSAFGGYQWWLGPSWSLGLAAAILAAPSVKMSDSNQNDTGYRFTPLSVGLEWSLLYY